MKKLLLLVLVAILAACSHKENQPANNETSNNSLVGTYSALDTDGKYYPRLTVAQEGGQYVLYGHVPFSSNPAHATYKYDGGVVPITQDMLSKLTGQPVSFQANGLVGKDVAIVQVPVGWTRGRFTSHTGYVLIQRAGLTEVQRDSKG